MPSTHKELSSNPRAVAHTVIRCREQSLAEPRSTGLPGLLRELQAASLGEKQSGHLRLCSIFLYLPHAHVHTPVCYFHTNTCIPTRRLRAKINQRSISEEIIIKSIKQNNTRTNKNGKSTETQECFFSSTQ